MMAKTTEVKESECAGTAAKEKVLTVSLVRPLRKSSNLFPVSMIYEGSKHDSTLRCQIRRQNN